jgi:hypothetical protein
MIGSKRLDLTLGLHFAHERKVSEGEEAA